MGIMAHIKQSSIWVPFSLLRGKDVSHSKLVELQQKFDELESAGAFSRPEDIGS